MVTRVFDDFDSYCATFASSRARVIPTGRGPFRGAVLQRMTDGVWLRQHDNPMPHLLRIEVMPRAVFAINMRPGPAPSFDGQVLMPDAVAWTPPGIEMSGHNPGGTSLCTWSFSLEDFEAAAIALRGEALAPPRGPHGFFRPNGVRLAGLRRALDLLGGPNPPRHRAFAEELLRITLDCVQPEAFVRRADSPRFRRAHHVVEGLVAMADSHQGQPLPLSDVCARLGVPLRSLNAYCNAVLGMGAGSYLRLRRLHAARATLRHGLAASVTDAATRHGFWELGRFASDYRAVFGELPSATLRGATALRVAAD